MESVDFSPDFISRIRRVLLTGVEVVRGEKRSEEKRKFNERVVLMVTDVK